MTSIRSVNDIITEIQSLPNFDVVFWRKWRKQFNLFRLGYLFFLLHHFSTSNAVTQGEGDSYRVRGGPNSGCNDTLNSMLSFLESYPDQFVGWTAWGENLAGTSIYLNASSNNPNNYIVKNVLVQHMQTAIATSTSTSPAASPSTTSGPASSSTISSSTNQSTSKAAAFSIHSQTNSILYTAIAGIIFVSLILQIFCWVPHYLFTGCYVVPISFYDTGC